MPAVDVRIVGAKRRDLDPHAAFDDEDHAELSADRDRVRKQALHLAGARAGGDVEIAVGRDPEQSIAHAATGEVGHVPGLA